MSIFSILNKTLNVANEIIPIYQKIRPMFNKFNKKEETKKVSNNLPTFFQ